MRRSEGLGDFGEASGAVDVVAFRAGQVEGEELTGNDGQKGRQTIPGTRARECPCRPAPEFLAVRNRDETPALAPNAVHELDGVRVSRPLVR